MKVLSLGFGVQSMALAAMAALGELPQVDFAIHADTTWERSATYEYAARWTPWLERHGVPVVTVRAEDADPQNMRGGIGIPAYTASPDGGTLRRQCTYDWKISPMRRYVQSVRNGQQCEMWIGISQDEWHRAKDADVQYLQHRWPLLELGMTRSDCVQWLERHDIEVPGKSSCVMCPFHNDRAWREMKRANGPDWKQACEVDAAIRDKRPPYPLYVHRRCVPLANAVQIPEDVGYRQDSLLDVCDSGFCWL